MALPVVADLVRDEVLGHGPSGVGRGLTVSQRVEIAGLFLACVHFFLDPHICERKTPHPGASEAEPKPRYSVAQPSPRACAMLRDMKVEEIAEAVANLPPDQLARFRRWFTAFEAGRADHAGELDSAASKLGRFAGRAFAEMKRRANNRE